MYQAKIILDSVSPFNYRLTTFTLTYPRFIHSEFMTHRIFSRNSASSRAIPVNKTLDTIAINPVIPVEWGTAKSGMQAGAETEHSQLAEKIWLDASKQMISIAEKLSGKVAINNEGEIVSDDDPLAIKLNLHKQIVNRILEPWMWMTVVCTSTDYDNFFALRCHPDAQPEIQKLAYMMKDEYEKSIPQKFNAGEWATPFIQDDEQDLNIELKKKISVARCARVSYLTHEGKRDYNKDLELYDRLINGSGSGHWSPFEHVAMATDGGVSSGNFNGWVQLRKFFHQEYQGK
jgi:Thymidylate synthase complementing protein